jgi:hypothetical protein
MIKEAIQKVREYFNNASEFVTRDAYSYWSRLSGRHTSRYSWDRPNYDYWRRAYYCKVDGLELSGLFIKPLVSKLAAWTYGRNPHWSLDSEASEESLADWWSKYSPDILAAHESSLVQGDMFLVFNPDMSLTAVDPDLVEPMVSDTDYSDVIGWRITQTFPHPQRNYDKQTVIDEYTLDGRTRIVEKNGAELMRESWPNLIGRIPVIHIANQPQARERFGHPEAEALVAALQEYGATVDAALDGNQLQGRPTPVLKFESVEAYNQFEEDYVTTEVQNLPDGTVQRMTTYNVDLSQLLVVVGAEFSYESPGSFAQDTIRLLEILFYLILEHTELPEFVFGNAISSSKASTETQLPVFIRFIEKRRAAMGKWLTEIAEIALAYLSLMQPGVGAAETPNLQWEQLEQDDGRLTLDTVTWAFTEGLIDRRTALMLAPVDVDDIDTVLEAAEQERQERMEEQQQQMLGPGGDIVKSFFNREIEANEEN